MEDIKKWILVSMVCAMGVMWSGSVCAAISLPYSETFDNLPTASMRNSTVGNWSGSNEACSGGQETMITPSAAYGGTGKGIRWWAGVGKNVNSSPIYTTLNGDVNEIWVRYYKRYQLGFAWSDVQDEKAVWLDDNVIGGNATVFESSRNVCWGDGENRSDAVYFWNQSSGSQIVCGPANTGWNTIQRGTTGDGQWHIYEIHVKKQTGDNGSDGVEEVWVDGVLQMSRNNLNLGTGWPKTLIQFQVNQEAANNPGCAYIDLDNIAISTTGYIGPIDGGGDFTPPSVSITAPSNGATVSGSTTVVVADASDDVAVAGVQFKVDGINIGSEDTSSPYSISWDTTSVSNGSHTLTAVARDTSNNTTTSSSISVTVSNASAPTVFLTANPTSIVSGQSSTLTWSSTNATSCTASGGWTGTKATSGSESVSPTSTTTFILTCTGAGGSGNSSVTVTVSTAGTIFFTEHFDDANFAARGWYDVTTGTIDTTNKYEGAGSLQCSFVVGGTGCQGNAPRRRKFTPSDSVYISYWTRMSSNWVGSGLAYHPHLIYLLTNLNGDYDGYYGTYLTSYLEQRDKTMVSGIQDALNIYGGSSPSQPPSPVTGENKGLAGCNGLFDGSVHGNTDQDCYWGGSLWLNGRWYNASAPSFSTTCPGSSCLTDWHHVEAYFKMNTVTAGVSNADGIMKVSVDGTVLYNYTDIRFRTGYGSNATKQFNQFGLSPYIGDGSPVAQTIWFDNLEVADAPPTISSVPCNTVTPTNFTDPTFTGYGAPYDVFASNTPLISTQCSSTDTHTLTATLGIPGDTTRIVYTKGYYYDSNISDWTSFTGTCTGALNGDWCQGSVSASVTNANISTASATDPAYVVGFTCSVQGGQWKCGCRDATCANFYWQIQGAGM